MMIGHVSHRNRNWLSRCISHLIFFATATLILGTLCKASDSDDVKCDERDPDRGQTIEPTHLLRMVKIEVTDRWPKMSGGHLTNKHTLPSKKDFTGVYVETGPASQAFEKSNGFRWECDDIKLSSLKNDQDGPVLLKRRVKAWVLKPSDEYLSRQRPEKPKTTNGIKLYEDTKDFIYLLDSKYRKDHIPSDTAHSIAHNGNLSRGLRVVDEAEYLDAEPKLGTGHLVLVKDLINGKKFNGKIGKVLRPNDDNTRHIVELLGEDGKTVSLKPKNLSIVRYCRFLNEFGKKNIARIELIGDKYYYWLETDSGPRPSGILSERAKATLEVIDFETDTYYMTESAIEWNNFAVGERGQFRKLGSQDPLRPGEVTAVMNVFGHTKALTVRFDQSDHTNKEETPEKDELGNQMWWGSSKKEGIIENADSMFSYFQDGKERTWSKDMYIATGCIPNDHQQENYEDNEDHMHYYIVSFRILPYARNEIIEIAPYLTLREGATATIQGLTGARSAQFNGRECVLENWLEGLDGNDRWNVKLDNRKNPIALRPKCLDLPYDEFSEYNGKLAKVLDFTEEGKYQVELLENSKVLTIEPSKMKRHFSIIPTSESEELMERFVTLLKCFEGHCSVSMLKPPVTRLVKEEHNAEKLHLEDGKAKQYRDVERRSKILASVTATGAEQRSKLQSGVIQMAEKISETFGGKLGPEIKALIKFIVNKQESHLGAKRISIDEGFQQQIKERARQGDADSLALYTIWQLACERYG